MQKPQNCTLYAVTYRTCTSRVFLYTKSESLSSDTTVGFMPLGEEGRGSSLNNPWQFFQPE